MREPTRVLWLPAHTDSEPVRAQIARLLSREQPVSRVDLDTDPATFEPAAAVAQLAAVLDQQGASRAAFVAVGLGATAALRFAAGHPERLVALVLATNLNRPAPLVRSVHTALLRLVPTTAYRRFGASPARVLSAWDQTRPIDVRGIAGSVNAPTLVLCGEHDRVNQAASAALARALPASRLLLVPGAFEGWRAEQPDRFSQLATDFVREQTGAA